MDSTVKGAHKQEKKGRLSAINTAGGGISIANCWERTSSSVRDLRESKRPTDQRGLAKRQAPAPGRSRQSFAPEEQRHTLSKSATIHFETGCLIAAKKHCGYFSKRWTSLRLSFGSGRCHHPQLLWKATRKECVLYGQLKYEVKSNIKIPTGLAELRRTAAFPGEPNNSYHFGPNARASLLATGPQGAHRGVRLAAVILLQRAHVSTDAAALGHALPWHAHLSALHFGCKDTVSRGIITNEDESGKGKDRRGVLDETSGTQRSNCIISGMDF